MISKPSGTVTFLFTDIENSTLLAREHPETWEAARARHHAILREAIESNNGYVFQIIGDAFCAAFHKAGDALKASLKAQRNLQAEAWDEVAICVRMGIHTGEAENEGNEYRGYTTLSLVQRLMSTGNGGQILISSTTENLLQEQLPRQISLRDMGMQRFASVPSPLRVFQVTAPNLPSEFPPLRTPENFPNNLPTQLTSFVGREKELAEVKRLLSESRLATLTGAGGCGKTRLALQVAANLVDAYNDGVWLIELAPLADPMLIPQAVAAALSVREQPDQPILSSLVDYLRSKHLLLVLDNCEHLIDASAHLADALLHACPNLRILATSREALNIAGENAWTVPSLSLPDVGQKRLTFTELLQYEAVQLFVDRAVAVQPSFKLTELNAQTVTQVCQRLDGIPLAIELAAARMKVLQSAEIVARLDDRFHLLTTGSRTALPRHQTLRAAIDWSYDLLSEPERVLLRRLSVFAGGCTLNAVEQVCTDEIEREGISPSQILDLLSHLVDKSLVIVDEQSGETRYQMLETIRQYAGEKLLESGEPNIVQGRHVQWFVNFAEQAEPELGGSRQTEWLNRLRREYANLRAALVWSLENDAGIALRLAAALLRFWDMRGHLFGEPIVLLERILSTKEAPGQMDARAKILNRLGQLKYLQADDAGALPVFEKALALYQELNDENGCAQSLYFLGEIHASRGNDAQAHTYYTQARSSFLESLVVLRGLGDKWREARSIG